MTSDPRGNHERAASGHGGAATVLIISTCGVAGYAVVGAGRAAGQPSRPSLPSPVIEDARCMLGCRHTVSRTYGPGRTGSRDPHSVLRLA
jgi:hypothetical protein